ncbi:EamA family transporter [Luteibacter aegosomaticola]|uniref:DMT family transporter n=1 Tax=Luteibacter aegosomaticola TaxID=2911538 RepID=UPI001FFB05C1|nr:EamA family transporter [Luteibacter aegosomaticola]UPG92206.1 EamA family transporter [Luteibacter aegosomaticola]
MQDGKASAGAVTALGATVVIWAFSWIVMKLVLKYAGPFDFSALRYSIGAALLFAVLVVMRRPLAPPPLGGTIVTGLAQTAAFQGLGQFALTSGGTGHVVLLAYAMPFWAVLLAWWLLGERPARRHWIGLGLAAIGLTCVIAPWNGLGNPVSTIFALVGGMCWALGTVTSKRTFQRYNPDPLTFTAWQMAFGAAGLAIVAFVVPQRAIDWSPAFIAGLAYSVILATSLAWTLWLLVVRKLPTAVASVSSLAVPVISVLMAWVVLHEAPTGSEWLGMVFIVAGLVAVSGVRLARSTQTPPAGGTGAT